MSGQRETGADVVFEEEGSLLEEENDLEGEVAAVAGSLRRVSDGGNASATTSRRASSRSVAATSGLAEEEERVCLEEEEEDDFSLDESQDHCRRHDRHGNPRGNKVSKTIHSNDATTAVVFRQTSEQGGSVAQQDGPSSRSRCAISGHTSCSGGCIDALVKGKPPPAELQLQQLTTRKRVRDSADTTVTPKATTTTSTQQVVRDNSAGPNAAASSKDDDMVDEGGYGERKEEKNDEENSTLKEGTVAAADAAAGYSAEGIAKIVEVLRANLDQSQDREEVEQEEKGVGNHHSVKTGLSFDGIEDKNTTNSGGASSGALSEFQFSKKSKKAMYALASVAKHEECVDHIVQSGGVSVLIEAIGRCVNAKNVSVSRAHNKQQMMNQQASSKVSLHKTAEYILKNACLVLGFVAMNGQHRKQVIEQGGVGALVHVLRCYSALCVQSQKGVGYASGLLSKQENNQVASGLSQIAQFDDTDAKKSFLSCLLVTQGSGDGRTPINTIARRAAGAVANLAHEDVHTKNLVREEGGIPALVLLLKAREFSVQVAAASTLKAISFRNEDNKNQIVECGALGSLVCMLRSSDPSIHYEAVAVMSSLVHSSAHIKKLVLNGGALQPLINLLSSKDMESRREAALLLGQFANVQDPDYKTKIVQRGALGPLIAMLSEESVQVSEMAAFAIGRLAQNKDNQAGIVQAGGLQPLLQLLSSKYLNSQHNAAFALYGLSDNDDNVPHFLKSGCVSILLSGKFEVQASKDCVRNTLRKLEERISQSHVLNHLKYLLSSEGTGMQTKYYIATGLAFLAPLAALYNIFMENHGMDVLFFNALNSHCVSCQKESIEAIHTLGKRTSAFSNLPTIEKGVKPGIYDATDKPFLGEFYLNNPTMSDVIFEVEGKIIYAHKIALLAASDQFCDMISASETRDNRSYIAYGDQGIGFSTLMKILSYVYSGHVHIKENDKAFDLLGQAEKLNLGGLKYACETFLMASIDAHSVSSIFDLAMRTNTTHLQKAAVWYSISEYSRLVLVHGAAQYTNMLSKMLDTFVRSL